MTWEISKFVIGLTIIGLVMVGFNMFLAHGVDVYELSGYDSAELEQYNKLELLANESIRYQSETDTIRTNQGTIDRLGEYFGGGYTALKLMFGSFSIFQGVLSTALKIPILGAYGGFLFKAILIIVLIIFVAIALKAITKVDI